MDRSARTRGHLPPVSVALVAVLVASLALVEQGTVLVQQCVAGGGVVGRLGLGLVLLRADEACPTGTFALGGDGRHVLGVVVLVAVPALLTHLAALAAGLGLLARAAAALRHVARVVTQVLPGVPEAPHAVVVPTRSPAWVDARPADDLTAAAVPWRRGPPALLPV